MSQWRAEPSATFPTGAAPIRPHRTESMLSLTLVGAAKPVKVLSEDAMRIEYVLHNQSSGNVYVGPAQNIQDQPSASFVVLPYRKYRSKSQMNVYVWADVNANISIGVESMVP